MTASSAGFSVLISAFVTNEIDNDIGRADREYSIGRVRFGIERLLIRDNAVSVESKTNRS